MVNHYFNNCFKKVSALIKGGLLIRKYLVQNLCALRSHPCFGILSVLRAFNIYILMWNKNNWIRLLGWVFTSPWQPAEAPPCVCELSRLP